MRKRLGRKWKGPAKWRRVWLWKVYSAFRGKGFCVSLFKKRLSPHATLIVICSGNACQSHRRRQERLRAVIAISIRKHMDGQRHGPLFLLRAWPLLHQPPTRPPCTIPISSRSMPSFLPIRMGWLLFLEGLLDTKCLMSDSFKRVSINPSIRLYIPFLLFLCVVLLSWELRTWMCHIPATVRQREQGVHRMISYILVINWISFRVST